ncbi:MAG: hypothetical protein LC620_00545 [Halobacteriales archaeon]|nr:hypothetical protein [Halobacteriales archaeon]
MTDEKADWHDSPGNAATRAAAAIEGAMAGAAEGMDKHGLPAATHRAIDQVDRLAERVARHPADRPSRPSRTAQRLHALAGTAEAKMHEAQEFVDGTIADVRYKARAIGETGRRAAAAPAIVSRDLGKAAGAWGTGLLAGAGWMLGLAVAGVLGLVLFTMAAVAGLTPLIGAGWALFVVGCAHAALALACLATARAVQARANEKAQQHLAQARADLEQVSAPVREAFGRPAVPRTPPIENLAPIR